MVTIRLGTGSLPRFSGANGFCDTSIIVSRNVPTAGNFGMLPTAKCSPLVVPLDQPVKPDESDKARKLAMRMHGYTNGFGGLGAT